MVRLKEGAGDPLKISMIGGSNLLGLLFPCVYRVIYRLNSILIVRGT